MLIIANSYRRLNLWKANCSASFEWVGHAISPYLGFLTGWLIGNRSWGTHHRPFGKDLIRTIYRFSSIIFY